MSLESVELGDIFEVSSSKRVLKKDWQDTGVPFYRTREIVSLAKRGYAKGDVYISEELFEEYKAKYGVPNHGDILISAIGSLGIAYAVKPEDKFYFKDASVLKLSPKKDVDTSYILHALKTKDVLGQINSVSGSTVGTLTITRAKRLKIPLPPLPEQKRIAAILDQADALRRQRQRALDHLNQLGQSIFYEMFGDPVSNPKNLQKIGLGDVIHSASDGPHVSPKYAEEGIPFISMRHIKTGKVIWNDLKYVTIDEAERQWRKCKPEKGDILYSKGGTTGIAAIVDVDFDFAVWVHVALLKPDLKKVNSRWLCQMLNSQYCYAQSQNLTRGIVNRDLGLKRMVNIEMYLPDLERQEKYASRLIDVDKISINASRHLAEAEQLFASLQQRAFRGEL